VQTVGLKTLKNKLSKYVRLAAAGELRAHRHEGFWECMDTYKDAVALNDLWASGEAPWAQAGSRRARYSATGSRIPRRRRSPA